MMKKKAQAWGFDLVIAVILFTAGIILFYLYSSSNQTTIKKTSEDLSSAGKRIADDLLSGGYPENWQEQTVNKIGIVNNDRINETKLAMFNNLTLNDYQKAKSLFDSNYDWYVSASIPFEIEGQEVGFIGLKNNESNDLIKTTRVIIYKNKPVNLYIYTWK